MRLGLIWQLLIHAARLLWSELRAGPRSMRHTVDLLRGASPPPMGTPAIAPVTAPPDAPRSRVARMMSLVALGLLRRGHVRRAAAAIATVRELQRNDAGVQQVAAAIEGELAVLSGQWRPLPVPDRLEPKPGHILHVVGKSLPEVQAGYTIRTDSIVRAQAALGLQPAVVSGLGFPPGNAATARRDEIDGIPHYRLGGEPVPADWSERLDAALGAVLPVVDDFRPALVHAHSDFQNALVAVAAARARSLPVVYEVRGFWEETWLSSEPGRHPSADRYTLRREQETTAMHRADLVVTLSEIMRQNIIDRGVAAAKVRVVPNAVDVERFPVAEIDHRLRADIGVDPSSVLIGAISSLTPYEGHLGLIDAVARCRSRGLPVELMIVGTGVMVADIERRIARHDLGGAVHVVGQVPADAVAARYAAVDIVAIPRTNDRVARLVTPLKPFEALATGRPLIVTDVPPLAEIADGSQAACVAPVDDVAGLAAAIETLAGDADLRVTLGRRGAAWVRDHHTWRENAARYEEIYRELGAID